MRPLLSRADVDQLLADHGLAPRRDLGQNFVADPNTVRRIARLAERRARATHVVEIGAGLGSLTLALAETGARGHGRRGRSWHRAGAARRSSPTQPNVTVVEADAMRLDWDDAARRGADSWMLVANLPYNVATPLVCDLLDGVPAITRMLVMVQTRGGASGCARRRARRRTARSA